MGDNRLGKLRLESSVKVPKNFVAPVFAKTKQSRDCDVVRWLYVQSDRGDRNARFVLRTMQKNGFTVNDLIVEGLLRLVDGDSVTA
mgnify:CR=1 FL=1